MENNLRILILEDLPSDADLAKRELKSVMKNPEFKVVDNKQDYINALKVFRPSLIISDYSLPTFDGLSALKIRQDKYPTIPFIILTGSMNDETQVECMKAGADDYVIKENNKRLGKAAISTIKRKNIEKKKK